MTVKSATTGGGLKVDVIGKEVTSIAGFFGATTETSVVFEENRIIHEFDKTSLQTGSYSHPFSIYLPGSIPASLSYKDASGNHCGIFYTLTARLGDVVLEQELTIVGKPLSSKVYTRSVHPTCFPLKTLGGLVDHGFVVLAAKVENTHVAKGQKANLYIACSNKSNEEIQFGVQLLEELDYKAGGKEKKVESRLNTEMQVELPGLTKGMEPTTSSRKEKMEVDGPLYAQLQSDLSSRQNLIKIKVPSKALDSYKGNLVQVSHYLKIVVAWSGRLDGPSILIPISVFDPPVAECDNHSPSKEKVTQIGTTIWPDDDVVLQHRRSASDGSLGEVKE